MVDYTREELQELKDICVQNGKKDSFLYFALSKYLGKVPCNPWSAYDEFKEGIEPSVFNCMRSAFENPLSRMPLLINRLTFNKLKRVTEPSYIAVIALWRLRIGH